MNKTGLKILSFISEAVLSAGLCNPGISEPVLAFGEVYKLAIDTSSRPFIWPLPSSNRISTCFTCGRAHNAIDISAPIGEKIIASCDGIVEDARVGCTHFAPETPCDCFGSTGNCVVLRHNINGIDYWTVYMHMNDVYVEQGQEVKQGEVIGTVGSTGRAYGPHLDFSIRLDYAWSQNKLDPGYNTVLPSELVRNSSNDCCVEYLNDITHRSYKQSEAPVLSGNIGCSTKKSDFSWGLSLSAEKYSLIIKDSEGNDHSVNDISKDDFKTDVMLPVGIYKAFLETSYPDGSKINSNVMEFEIGEAPLLECSVNENKINISWSEVSDAKSYLVHVNRHYISPWDPDYDYSYPYLEFDPGDKKSAELVLPEGDYLISVDAVIDDKTFRESNSEKVVCENDIALSYEKKEDGSMLFSWPGCSYPGKYQLTVKNSYNYDDYSLYDLEENSAVIELPPGDYSAYVRYLTGEYDYFSSEYIYFNVEEPDLSGDADGDGVIGCSDALWIKSYLLTVGQELPEIVSEYADTNKNGSIDIFDMIRLRRRMLEEM